MQLLLTGSTGTIGSQILTHCLSNPHPPRTYTGNPITEVQYPLAFADAFLRSQRESQRKSSTTEKKDKFRFVFLRGAYTVEDQERSLWWMGMARRGNGQGEKPLRLYAQTHSCTEIWETHIMKPGGSDEVAACIVDVAVHGSEEGRLVWLNGDMVSRGRAVLGV
ncbi:hypothetical protein HYFRA_00006667 [Hymenoscyphus fraxineus]|uniref:Thioester reductase (TE) domain-containing protein n=1 Tax=Hymenoscyphus fraxineus TaxID=746836 RepID=A0A9N9KVB8_9HELO|nr:hypothetical protein HYFRA_00006667 [Hymenoscyphus fraxineus]